ncbi:hypothetical protein GCM10007857_41890 [Bradyrhizobium iriomotense]|uniref:Uncharacterized protein n=1 Tax=Bradyrhizobium iriomotense TaxID=441950 RepID=A0ABQ6AZY4_9BRAD|nr:hypothetical protein GCM10007857_41890 [Bradyrhizobium iriomotense]
MIGYCATGNSGIEIAPTKQMNSATTQAKIGLSMKKLGICRFTLVVSLVPHGEERGTRVSNHEDPALSCGHPSRRPLPAGSSG